MPGVPNAGAARGTSSACGWELSTIVQPGTSHGPLSCDELHVQKALSCTPTPNRIRHRLPRPDVPELAGRPTLTISVNPMPYDGSKAIVKHVGHPSTVNSDTNTDAGDRANT